MDWSSSFHQPYFKDSDYLEEDIEPNRYGDVGDSSDEESEESEPGMEEESNKSVAKDASKQKIGDGYESENEDDADDTSVASETSEERKERKREARKKEIADLPVKVLDVPQPKLKNLKLTPEQQKNKDELLAIGYDEWEIQEMMERNLTMVEMLNRTLFVSLAPLRF